MSAEAEPCLVQQLVTVRDWLRYAVSRFTAAGLVYGHGTATPLDEAAYLILHTLHLPVDELDPWLGARLTLGERRDVEAIIQRRISSRKPASYLTNEAWIGGQAFYVDERAIVPRSYIGELLAKGLPGAVANADGMARILDLCSGSGCLAVLAALAFPDAAIDASDVAQDALAVAARNVRDYHLESRISLIHSDLFTGLAGRRYDLILANPPYVAADAIAAFPPEYAAEPQLAHSGGVDGLDLVRSILATAADHLAPDGTLVMEVGRASETLEREFPNLPFLWLDTEESEREVLALSRSQLQQQIRNT